MKNTIRSLILIATSLAAGAAIALGVSCRLTVHVPDILSGGKDTTAGK